MPGVKRKNEWQYLPPGKRQKIMGIRAKNELSAESSSDEKQDSDVEYDCALDKIDFTNYKNGKFNLLMTNFKKAKDNLGTGTLASSPKTYSLDDVDFLMTHFSGNFVKSVVKVKGIPLFTSLTLPVNDAKLHFRKQCFETTEKKRKEIVKKEIQTLRTSKPLVQIRSSFAPFLTSNGKFDYHEKKNEKKDGKMGTYRPSVILMLEKYSVEFWCKNFSIKERKDIEMFEKFSIDMSNYVDDDLRKEGYFSNMYLMVGSIHTCIQTIFAPTYLGPKLVSSFQCRGTQKIIDRKYDFDCPSVIILDTKKTHQLVNQIVSKLEYCIDTNLLNQQVLDSPTVFDKMNQQNSRLQ